MYRGSARLTKRSSPMLTELRETVFAEDEPWYLDMNHHPIAAWHEEDGLHVIWAVRVKEEK